MSAPVPARITMALDVPAAPGAVGPLEGPGVDEFCGVAEPTVDRWEAGELTPTEAQLAALAELTGGFLCIRSGKGRGCHPLGEPAGRPVQQVLFGDPA